MTASTVVRVHLVASICLALLLPAPAPAETVILQQGAGGYDGCVTETISREGKGQAAPAEVLAFRGARNYLRLRFELPQELRGKRLARARLEVFVPEVRKPRMICEIACRQVLRGWPGGLVDETTDYGNGRPGGVVDSYAIWEYDGRYFPHRYRFLAVPEGGKWIDLNVTPLARKWLAEPSSNRGVVLTALHLGDRRFNGEIDRIEIDIPAAASKDAARRPRLVLDFEPLATAYLVAMTHTLRKYCDRDTRYRFFGPFTESYELAMARNEFEGFQVLVHPISKPLAGVTFEWTDLAGPGGASIPKADICYHVQDVFRLHPNSKIKDWYFHGHNFDVPDPLTTARPVDLPVHASTPSWFTVRTRPGTKAGVYRGRITVRPAGAAPRELELAVRVWDYRIPEKWNFRTMGQTCWGPIRRCYPKLTGELKRRYVDFLLDHRFNPTEQYIEKLSPDAEDIPHCFARGGNTIYLSGNFTSKSDIGKLKERYEAVRKLGLIDHALVYIGDETKDWAEMRRRSDRIRRACPELMIMIGGSFPRPELDGVIDVFDPQIDRRTNQVYSLPAEQMRPLIGRSQQRGESFFWYVAAGPMLPCPNVQMEDPLIASRVLFWLTWKFGVTGFEYYCYNIWSHNLPDKDGRRWPQKPFYPRGWGETNGDGMLFYPGPDGPFSSVRFENIRDGIEDWESHYVLRDYADALEAKLRKDASLRAEGAALLARARKVLEVPDEVCPMSFTEWTWQPEVLLKARRSLGETIEALTKLISEEEMLATRAARHAAELKRQRNMLRQRAEAARVAPQAP
jgi:hypothetical protein